ncbi:MAG: PucR family transcriptional regulator, partial [Clostridia bacterium]|nr:PucR family transcriptional regulator [Clostridia bacterium]
MASKLFQSIVSQMHGTIERTIGVLDAQGTVIACSDLSRIGEDDSANMPAVGGYTYSTAISAGRTYRAIGNDIRPEYVIFVEGGDEFADKMAGVLSIA